ncbi:Na+/H+ antiporter subunit D [Sporosarcina sp. Sa2YVA2]|uniref:Na+/H+ antiporter subunit D n=1 Tax=Sporosarcina quadrami TaxID=2762234 RepID=A0ABR8U7X2_9BACL|nr:Na+/H+ antiporter subunit D [Sporosarcina quadrami]MBD7983895.1 Na+/H+ antiporter subunit D [Sporosarcina quadrami]
MNNIIAFPMIIPLLTGIILVFFRNKVIVQRIISMISILATLGISIYILQKVLSNGILRLDFGGWLPPYGILFVADSFSMLLVVTTLVVTAILLVYAFSSIPKAFEKMFFYPFLFFLIAGVVGSFLTGDLFNLFVCFEVMLLSSYALITLGGRKIQLVESIKYISINVLSSWFFLLGIAYLYGSVGTLNMAHLSMRVAEVGQGPVLTVISIIFLLVFSLKAGLLLYYWLPGSYSAPPTVVAALFGALLTKVGMYAMIRVFTLIFYHEPQITHTLIGIMAVITLIGGSVGAIAYNDLRRIVSYNVIISVGFILIGLAVSTESALQGTIYYLIHDMIVKALLFLIAGTIIYLTGKTKIEKMSGLIQNYPVLGWMFFVTMLSLAGIPPLSGFIGKVYIGQGSIEAGAFILLGIGFLSSIFVLYSLLRIFMNCFWGETIISVEDEVPIKKGMIVPIVLLGILTFGLGVGVEAIAPYVSDAANTLMNPQIYIDAVMKRN